MVKSVGDLAKDIEKQLAIRSPQTATPEKVGVGMRAQRASVVETSSSSSSSSFAAADPAAAAGEGIQSPFSKRSRTMDSSSVDVVGAAVNNNAKFVDWRAPVSNESSSFSAKSPLKVSEPFGMKPPVLTSRALDDISNRLSALQPPTVPVNNHLSSLQPLNPPPPPAPAKPAALSDPHGSASDNISRSNKENILNHSNGLEISRSESAVPIEEPAPVEAPKKRSSIFGFFKRSSQRNSHRSSTMESSNSEEPVKVESPILNGRPKSIHRPQRTPKSPLAPGNRISTESNDVHESVRYRETLVGEAIPEVDEEEFASAANDSRNGRIMSLPAEMPVYNAVELPVMIEDLHESNYCSSYIGSEYDSIQFAANASCDHLDRESIMNLLDSIRFLLSRTLEISRSHTIESVDKVCQVIFCY